MWYMTVDIWAIQIWPDLPNWIRLDQITPDLKNCARLDKTWQIVTDMLNNFTTLTKRWRTENSFQSCFFFFFILINLWLPELLLLDHNHRQISFQALLFNIKAHRTDFHMSYVNLHGQPTVTACSDHYIHTCHPNFSKSSKTNKSSLPAGLWDGRVDHWWFLSYLNYILHIIQVQYMH